jgi:hypothetical protein
MSIYRVLSLDRSTGAVKDQMQFEGHWGHMPYLYAAGVGSFLSKNRLLSVGSGNIRLLNDQGKSSLSGKTEKAHSPLLELISRARVSLCRQAREEAIPLFYSTNAFSSTMSVLSPRSQ